MQVFDGKLRVSGLPRAGETNKMMRCTNVSTLEDLVREGSVSVRFDLVPEPGSLALVAIELGGLALRTCAPN
ncbi:MAG: hypothetical protein DCC71_04645 [Proteobacteria bacterium]|nr:MAG: hypothetical protein DCC71_04645 [Pseudomonadota bacterium]